jgi:hypothetical protein
MAVSKCRAFLTPGNRQFEKSDTEQAVRQVASLVRVQVSILSQHLDASLLSQSIDNVYVKPLWPYPSVGHFLHLEIDSLKNRTQNYLRGTIGRNRYQKSRYKLRG